jgi:unspecific monooxygenase
VSRRLLKPFVLGDLELPTGTAVAASILVAHHRADVFPDSRAFRPERFLGERSFSSSEYFPFGGGLKRCLGAAMASYEMKIVLGTLVLNADLELAQPKRARAGVRPGTVGPKGGVPIVLKSFSS